MCGLVPAAAGCCPAGLGADTGRPVGPINAMELSLSITDRKMGVHDAKEKSLRA
jgi:hypothetical protein